MRTQVSVVICKTYNTGEVEARVREAVALLGGIGRFIKPNSKVLIKPNLLSARMPEEAVTTHPEVVRAVCRLAKAVTSEIFVGDSPGGLELKDVDKVYDKSGIKRVCQEEGIRLIKFDKATTLDGFPIASIAKEADAIISVPKLKTHSTTVLTGAIKNTFGMVIGLHKAKCHLLAPKPDEFARMLVRVFGLVTPALSIMDGVVGMEGEGPAAGKLRNIGLILAGQDAVSLDAVVARLIGVEPHKIPLIQEAAKRELGIGDLRKIEILGEQLEKAAVKDFKLSRASIVAILPKPLAHFLGSQIKFYPYINKKDCERCGLCFDICPADMIEREKDGSLVVNTKGCINCFCCYEVCNYKAIKLKKSLLAKIIMRG